MSIKKYFSPGPYEPYELLFDFWFIKLDDLMRGDNLVTYDNEVNVIPMAQKKLDEVIIRPGFITLKLPILHGVLTDPQTHSLITGTRYEILNTIRTHLRNLTEDDKQVKEIPFRYGFFLRKLPEERTYSILTGD